MIKFVCLIRHIHIRFCLVNLCLLIENYYRKKTIDYVLCNIPIKAMYRACRMFFLYSSLASVSVCCFIRLVSVVDWKCWLILSAFEIM